MAEKAAEKPTNIPIPAPVQQRIVAASYQVDVLAAQYNGAVSALQGIIGTARELLGVPEGWIMSDPARGFEPPPAQPAQGEGGQE